MSQPGTPERRPASSSAIIALLSAAGLMVALQTTLVVPLLPDFPVLLDVSAAEVGWLVTITLLTGAIATPIVSRCADMFGKRRMLVLSLCMMVAGSLIAAIGGTFLTVLIGRTLQGFSSALIPVAMAILRDVVPPQKIASGAAMISATMGIGGALGMPASGVLFDAFGWESVFWASALVGVLLIVGIFIAIPASATGTRGRFDVAGAILLSVIMTALLLGISKGASWGWASAPTLICFVAVVVVLAVWVPLELRVVSPMVNLRVSARRSLLLANIAGLLAGFAAYANMLATTQQLQLSPATGFGFGLSAAVAGVCMVPGSLAMFVFAPISAKLTNRFGGRATLISGGVVMALAYGFRIVFDQTVTLIIVGAVVASIGNAMLYATLPAIINTAAPQSETAAANGLNGLARTIGSSSMSAVVAALLSGITITVAGTAMPAHGAFVAIFAVAAIASALAAAAAAFLPRPGAAQVSGPPAPR